MGTFSNGKNSRFWGFFRFPLHHVATYMEQVIENKIGKTVPFGLLSEAMNEPIGPVDNVIEKERIPSGVTYAYGQILLNPWKGLDNFALLCFVWKCKRCFKSTFSRRFSAMFEDWFISTSFIPSRMPRISSKENFDQKVFAQEKFWYKESFLGF